MIRWWKIKDFFRRIKPGLGNVIRWFPVIYKDRWWDHSFLYSILKKKLELMEEGFRTAGCSTNSEKDAKNMKICVLLLDRLINDAYIDYKNERGWSPKIRFSFEKEEEMTNQDLDILFKILRKQVMVDQDLHLLLKIMRKQIRCWWD